MPFGENTSLDPPVSPGKVFFSALTMSEPMSGGLRALCLCDNEGEKRERGTE